MKDKEFLQWIYDRLESVHGENPDVDYMHKLRSIIDSTDPEKLTPNVPKPLDYDKRFPVSPNARMLEAPKSIRWSALNEDRAFKNHNQTLKELAERHGLHVLEIMANVGDYSIFSERYELSKLISRSGKIQFLEGIQW